MLSELRELNVPKLSVLLFSHKQVIKWKQMPLFLTFDNFIMVFNLYIFLFRNKKLLIKAGHFCKKYFGIKILFLKLIFFFWGIIHSFKKKWRRRHTTSINLLQESHNNDFVKLNKFPVKTNGNAQIAFLILYIKTYFQITDV